MDTPIKPDDYAQATALVTHATIKRSLESTFPKLTSAEHDQMFLTIIDRIARMRGYIHRYERETEEVD